MAGTVVEVTEVFVEAPLRDAAPAFVKRLAICSTFEDAANCAQQRMVERSGDGGLLYYALQMIILDTAHQTAPTAIFGADNKPRGMIPGDVEKPWGGRTAVDCKFKRGDLVGFVHGDVYRIGVVIALPPSPVEAEQLGNVTVGDDVYLVGLIDGKGIPAADDHDHIARPRLFPVEHEIPPELRVALRKRFERSGWVKVST